jgi:hypothetical protein
MNDLSLSLSDAGAGLFDVVAEGCAVFFSSFFSAPYTERPKPIKAITAIRENKVNDFIGYLVGLKTPLVRQLHFVQSANSGRAKFRARHKPSVIPSAVEGPLTLPFSLTLAKNRDPSTGSG